MATDTAELKRLIDELTQRVNKLESGRNLRRIASAEGTNARQQEQLEGWIAGYWFARLGIISMVTGVAFLVADSLSWLGAPLKILLGYGVAGACIATGHWLSATRLAFGRILTAGGLGIAYYATYAMHYVPSARLVTSPVLAFLLLAAMVVLIIAVAHRMQSETVAGVALFLGLHTGMASAIGSFTLLSSVLLAAGAAFFLAKNRWVYVPISTLLAVYGTHVLWILGNPMIATHASHDAAHFGISIPFAVLYFAIFGAALVLAAQDLERRAAAIFAELNWAAFVTILCFEYHYHHEAGAAFAMAVLAAAMTVLALLNARIRGRGVVFEVHVVLAVVTLALASWMAAEDASLVLAWCALSLAALAGAKMLAVDRLAQLASVILGLAYLAHLPHLENLWLGSLLGLTTFAHDRLSKGAKHFTSAALAHPAALAGLAMLAFQAGVPANILTLSWMACAVVFLVLGVKLAEFSYRIVAMLVLLVAFAHLFVVDMADLASGYRIAAFLGLGLSLLAISYGYNFDRRERDVLQRGAAGAAPRPSSGKSSCESIV